MMSLGGIVVDAGLPQCLTTVYARRANTRMKRPGRRGGHSLGKC
jgi:hypothetical protein